MTPDALAEDLSLVAEARGWSTDEASAYHIAEQAVGQIAEKVATVHPEVFVGSALSTDPRGAPTLYIKGPADEFVRDLVASAPILVKLADNQPLSLDELEARKRSVHEALEAIGYRSVATGVNITGMGVIRASVMREPNLPDRVATILSELPASMRSIVMLDVVDAPLAVPEAAAFGGMWLWVGPNRYATSGWTVSTLDDLTKGVSGPGHGIGISKIEVPGQGLFDLTY